MKKLLALLTSIAVIMAMVPSMAFASITETDVAVIGDTGYETLEDAVAAAKDGETVRLLEDCHGNGIIVPSGSNLTIDFGGHVYTVDGDTLAGSTGTKSQCFQLLKGSTITMKSGEIIADNSNVKMMIQNYSNLTLEDMTLDATKGTNSVTYVLSNNCGNVNITGSTSITAKDGKCAFDVYYWPSGNYPEGVNVTVNTSGTITGRIEYGSDGSGTAADDMHDKAKLDIIRGTINGNIVVDKCTNPTIVASDSYEFTPTSNGYAIANYVAKIGDTNYTSLEAAVTAVKDGETITLLDSCHGNGIIVKGDSNRTFTIDFNGNTYTVDGDTLAGSTGTKSQCFQLLKGSAITMKNGSIIADNSNIKMMIQNYSNLTLEDMTLNAEEGTNSVGYVLSNNCGNVNITGNTCIAAKEGKCAFDVYYWPSGNYPEGVNVTVDTTGTIIGTIEYDSDNKGTAAADMHDKAKLEIKNGTFIGEVNAFACDVPNIAISGGSFSTDVSEYVIDGYKATKDDNDMYSVAVNYVAKIGDTSYTSLEAAVAAVKTGETITVLKDCNGNGIIVKGDNSRAFTIDFDGHTYTVDGNTLAGSTGTQTQCFQLLKGSTITMKNGAIVADNSKIKMMIQNYSNLTLEDMTLDATMGTNSVGYVLSNNCGNVNIAGNTSITAKDGKCAFDVYYWPSGNYPEGVNVTVDTTGTITGTIEYGSDGKGTAAADMNSKAKLDIQHITLNGAISTYSCDNPNIAISGGSFSTDVSEYVVDGYKATKGDNGMYSVVQNSPASGTGTIGGGGALPTDPLGGEGETVLITNDVATKTTNVDMSLDTAVTDNTAKTTISDETAEKIIAAVTESKSETIAIDTAGANESAKSEVVFSSSAAKNIADKTNAYVAINTNAGKVGFNADAFSAMAAQIPGGDSLTIVINKTSEDNAHVDFEISLVTSSGVNVVIPENVTLDITMALPKDINDVDVVCACTDENGYQRRIAGTKNTNGTYTFAASALTGYSIMSVKAFDENAVKMAKKVTKRIVVSKSEKGNVKLTVKYTKTAKKLKAMGYKVSYKYYYTKTGKSYKAIRTSAKSSTTWSKFTNGKKYGYKYKMIVKTPEGETIYTSPLRACKITYFTIK